MPDTAASQGEGVTSARLQGALSDALVNQALPGEVDGLDKARLKAVSTFIADAVGKRTPGKPVIRVGSGGIAESGQRLSWVAVNTDDMPFLVDSVAAAITAHGLAIERLLHPVIDARRGANGVLQDISPAVSGQKPDGVRESLIFLEIERADARTRALLAKDIAAALAEVRLAVADWPAMLERLEADRDAAGDAEVKAFLGWLADNNFTFLGCSRIALDGAEPPFAPLGILRGEGARGLVHDDGGIDAGLKALADPAARMLIVKADRVSRVHRHARMDVIALPVRDAGGRLTGISSYAGLFTSHAIALPPEEVPLLSARVERLSRKLDFAPGGHAAKALMHAVTQLPRDLLFAAGDEALHDLAVTAMSLIDRPRPRAKTVSDPLGRYTNLLVWLPRDAFTMRRRQEIAAMAEALSGGQVDGWSAVMGEDALVSIDYVIRHPRGHMVDAGVIDARLQEMIRGWPMAVEAELREKLGASRAARLALTHANGFNDTYRSHFTPGEAATDIVRLSALKDASARDARIYTRSGDAGDQLRLKVYRSGAIIPLSEAVPVLENFGFRVIEEYPFTVTGDEPGWIHDFLLQNPGQRAGLEKTGPVLEAAICDVLAGTAENDPFNALIADAGLDAPEILLFRAWFRYMRQTGSAYGIQTVVDVLGRHAGLTRALVALFAAAHDPRANGNRKKRVEAADAAVREGLKAVTAIDDDGIIQRFLAIIRATLRTNAYAPSCREALALKLDSRAIPGLPAPVPWREIFIYSPRVEGIHLRSGPIARGGIRWSDRRDDFRTEILGLMKAQVVKNSVIVPTGAKGGFYAKQLPPPSNRDAWLAEGTEAYRIFIRALLSLTDNIVDGKVVHPKSVVINDADDPYFVVAADKGTASFSDIANAIADDRGFWLGDAFASGGSHGYDHKAMGITARGAWISVTRHFAELGVDVQNDPVTVAGVGDMSGDVFGNGMLLSKSIRLVAAFDHRHILLDPSPDPAKSWAERQRMFGLPRSSWADYNPKLISKGGGVFPRTQKDIPLSPEIRALLGVAAESLGPSALIGAILKAEVDLLWFGGIGTYIKAAHETNAEVGDRANDAQRINGREVRARVVGEGANLGVTQAGRVEYAARGGRINTDFIDNSAGVDCSDNEVNIKIALNAEMAAGRLGFEARNRLLERMTDNVAALVLEDNRLQTLALSLAERGRAASLPAYQRVIQMLEAQGRLLRAVEGLPDDEQIAQRMRDGQGLQRPELAVLLSYAKLALQDAIEAAAFVGDPVLEPVLIEAFPAEMAKRHKSAVLHHQLRPQIIATELANRIINRGGIIMPFALAEEEGAALGHVAAAYAAAEMLFDLPSLWRAIEEARVDASAQLAIHAAAADAVQLHIADLLRVMPPDAMPGETAARLRPGVEKLRRQLSSLLRDSSQAQSENLRRHMQSLGAAEPLAACIADLTGLDGAISIAGLAEALGRSGDEVTIARAYIFLGETLGLDWAKTTALALEPSDAWERLLIAGLVRDFEQLRVNLLRRIAAGGEKPEAAARQWLDAHAARVDQFRALIARARLQPAITPTILAQLSSQARVLLGRQD